MAMIAQLQAGKQRKSCGRTFSSASARALSRKLPVQAASYRFKKATPSSTLGPMQRNSDRPRSWRGLRRIAALEHHTSLIVAVF